MDTTVPFTEYLYAPIIAKGIDIKALSNVISANGSFLKDLICEENIQTM